MDQFFKIIHNNGAQSAETLALSFYETNATPNGSLICICTADEADWSNCMHTILYVVHPSGLSLATQEDVKDHFGPLFDYAVNRMSETPTGSCLLFQWPEQFRSNDLFEQREGIKYALSALFSVHWEKVANGYGGWDYQLIRS